MELMCCEHITEKAHNKPQYTINVVYLVREEGWSLK